MHIYQFRLFDEHGSLLRDSPLEASSDEEAHDLARIWFASSASHRSASLMRDGQEIAALNKDVS